MKAPCGIEVEVGQCWQELDVRWPQYRRVVTVVALDEARQRVRIGFIRNTWASLKRFNGKNGGYKFVPVTEKKA